MMLSCLSSLHRSLCLPTLLLVAAAVSVRADDSARLPVDKIESIVQQGIDEGKLPGAVVVIADRDSILYQQAFGDRQVEPKREPMTVDTVFDMASLTKPVATATSVMRLVQQGKIDVSKPVATYLPEFGRNGKDKITVADLLLHVGGLIPDNALSDYQHGVDTAWQRIWELEPRSAPGEKFAYTDVGFLVLGKLVEKISGQPLDRFASQQIFQPLGMKDTGYTPESSLRGRIAPTEKREGEFIRGQVHDPRAYLLDGVAGHAGMFSTAADMVRYGQMMLASGKYDAGRILDEATFKLMTAPRDVPRGSRTYGWDHRSPYSSNRGDALSDAAFGHGGFTGTVMWIDPELDRVFVFLSNRLHPDGEGSVNKLAGEIATLIGQAAR